MFTESKEAPQEEAQDFGAKELSSMIGLEEPEEKAEPAKAPKAESEEEKPEAEKPVPEITPEQREEMDDYQALIDKGYDSLSEEEKARYDDYKGRYATEEKEEDGEDGKDETPEAWKDYKEDDILKLIDEGKFDEVTDDHIEYLKSLGHKIEVEGGEEPEDSEEKETEKPEELLDIVNDLQGLEMFKDRKFESNEEAVEGMREYIRVQEDTNKKLTDILTNNPELTGVLTDLAQGKKPEDAIKKHFEDLFDEEAPKPGDDGYEDYVAKKIEKRKALEAENERKKMIAKNQQSSVDNAIKFVKSKNLPQDRAQDFFGKVDKYIQDLTSHVVTDEFLDLLYKGQNYDKAVKDAEAKGEIKGANRKITLEKRAPKGDGLRRVKRNVPREIKNEVAYENEDAKLLADFLRG